MDQTPIVTLASGHPLIDIDLTAVVQFALFLAVYVIANKFLFQPFLALRTRRKAGIEGARAEAERIHGPLVRRPFLVTDNAYIASQKSCTRSGSSPSKRLV